MAYGVNITNRAARDLTLLFDAIDAENSAIACAGYRGLKAAILSLEELPNRCPATAESSKLRQLLYGHKPHTYRIIFRVSEKSKQVDLLHIRHRARQPFRRSEIK